MSTIKLFSVKSGLRNSLGNIFRIDNDMSDCDVILSRESVI